MPRFLGYIYYEATTILQPTLGYINCDSNLTSLLRVGVLIFRKKFFILLLTKLTYASFEAEKEGKAIK